MCSFKSIYFVIFILNLYKAYGEISDKRLCIDPECKEPVSLARTLLRYSSPDPRILSFAPNAEVTIYSKEAGSVTNLWGAVINGKRGYVPKHLLREHKVLKKPTLLIDTEIKQTPQVPNEQDKIEIDPESVKKSYEVVDGTTIYLNPQDSVSPSSTKSPVLSTSLPSVSAPKEQPAQDSAKESVVDNVLTSFSNWINDDSESEELDGDEDDDDEDEEDGVDDEEDEEEEDNVAKTADANTPDVNFLHNLPEAINTSPDELNGTADTVRESDTKSPDPSQVSDSVVNSELPSTDSKESVQITAPPVLGAENVGNPQEVEATTDISDKLEKETNNTVSNKDQTAPNVGEQDPVRKAETLAVEDSGEIVPETTPPNLGVHEPIQKAETSAAPIEDSGEIVPETTPPNLGVHEPIQKAQTSAAPIEDSGEIVSETTPPNLGAQKPIQKAETPAAPIVKDSGVTVPEIKQSENAEQKPNNDELGSSKSKGNVEAVIAEEKKTEKEETLSNEVSSKPEEEKEHLHKEAAVLQGVNKENAAIVGTGRNLLSSPDKNEENANQAKLSDPELVSAPEIVLPGSSVETQNPGVSDEGSVLKTLPSQILFNLGQSSGVNSDQDLDKTVKDANVKEKQNVDSIDEIQESVSAETTENLTTEIPDTVEHYTEDSFSMHEIPPATDITGHTEDNEEKAAEEFEHDSQEVTPVVETNSDSDVQPEIAESEIAAENAPRETKEDSEEDGGIFSSLLSFFGGSSDEPNTPIIEHSVEENAVEENVWVPQDSVGNSGYCETASESCNTSEEKPVRNIDGMFEVFDLKFNSDFFLLLLTTAVSVIVLLFIYKAMDRHKREAPLIARINKLEKELLVLLKENELLQEKGTSAIQEVENTPNEFVEQLTERLAESQFAQQALQEKISILEKELEDKSVLEEQVESLEKELETSTEVGMELNRIISEMLDPTNGSDKLKENVEQLQRQLLEQKDTINTINETLREKEAENRTLRSDLEKAKKSAGGLQSKMDEMVEKILKIEREKDQQQNTLQNEINIYQQKYGEAATKEEVLNNDIQTLRLQLSEVQRQADLKTKEYQMLKESLDKIKHLKNDSDALKSLLNTTSIKAELQQLKTENAAYAAQLQQEQAAKVGFEKKYQAVIEEIEVLKQKYEQADKEKVEVNSKLEVLNNYFKKRESELQEEIIKYKAIWDAKQGEATSTTDRIRYMQEEIENYKAQNETLKQEIISQEIDLKSQISVLEKKVHENWVTARQSERKLEDARQEAAQLRNRLTLRERAINEERIQNRLQSPVEKNGELPLSPHPIDSPASPPLLYGVRDHITKSPPLPGLPPFLPPPPGAPFMPPPLHGMPPFMPPPPSMFPGDHRPPPLGRMSSPPLNSRYSPDTSAFSPYDRRSPSPPYDSEYGASPPPIRGYSPYNNRDDRRDYKRPPHVRMNGRNAKGSVMSSGSDHSNDSIDNINRKQSKMV